MIMLISFFLLKLAKALRELQSERNRPNKTCFEFRFLQKRTIPSQGEGDEEESFLFVADSALEATGVSVGTSGRFSFSDSSGSVVGTSGISSTTSFKQNIHHDESLSLAITYKYVSSLTHETYLTSF